MKRLLLLTALFLCSLFTYAQLLGSGTEDDPYMIYDADDMNEVRDYVGVSGVYFQLANDIDLSAYSEGEGWEPIGSSGAQFKGIFDGNGHTITNLKINRTTNNVGLFGYATSTIKNVRVECDIIGKGSVGGICGNGASFTDCRVSGSITGTGSQVGGICGCGYSFSKCKAEVNVTGDGSVGGIVGYSIGCSINICMVEGEINNTSSNTGGIIGYASNYNNNQYYSCSINNCIFLGTINGKDNTGGVYGNTYNYYLYSISRCFSNATIQGTSHVGGICGHTYGYYYESGSSYSYYCISPEKCVAANTSITASSSYGRIVGSIYKSSTISNFNNLSLSTTKIIVNGTEATVSDNVNNGTGVGNALLKRKATYTDLGWDFETIWDIDEGTSYPYLRCFNPTEEQTFEFEAPSLAYGDDEYTLPVATDQGLTIKWSCSDENKLAINGNTLSIKGAGSCYLIAEQAGDNIYKSLRKTYPITIAKAPLKITADNYTRNTGVDNPEFTASYLGFVYDDDESALKTSPTITTTATKSSRAGVYPITVSGAESDNYDISYVNGTLTINDQAALRNTLAIDQTVLRTDKSAALSISLNNEDKMIAFEFYMQLPDGISIVTDEEGYPDVTLNRARSNGHILEVADDGDGLYHFLCYSNSNYALKGNSGELLSINIVCDEGMTPDVYDAHLHTIKFSDNNKNRIMLSNIDFNIEVSDVVMGDVNDDGEIDVMDVVMMVNHIMGKPLEGFILAAGDHDGDGVVDVMDLVRQVALVMSQQASGASAYNNFDALESGLSLTTDDNGFVRMNIADGKRYVASQFVVSLSEGQQLIGVATDRSHKVNIHPLADNRYFVMCYSTSNAAFAANNEALTLQVAGQGAVSVEDIAFVDTDIQKVQFQNASTVTTGIDKAVMNNASPMDVYSPDGILMRKNATTTEGLRNGMYIINGKKHFVK